MTALLGVRVSVKSMRSRLDLIILGNVQVESSLCQLLRMPPFNTPFSAMYAHPVRDNEPLLVCRHENHQRLVNTIRYAILKQTSIKGI